MCMCMCICVCECVHAYITCECVCSLINYRLFAIYRAATEILHSGYSSIVLFQFDW